MADTLRQIYCVPQRRPSLDEFTVPEAHDCCIGACLLQRIAPQTTQASFMLYTSRTEAFLVGHGAEPGETQGFGRGLTPHGERRLRVRPHGRAPLYILHICIHLYVHIYIHMSVFCFFYVVLICFAYIYIICSIYI